MIVASRDGANRPVLCRGCGCEALDDGRLRVFVDSARGGPLLDSVRASNAIAAVFSEPGTHTTIQLKGTDGMIVPPGADYASLLGNYRDAFVSALLRLGYPESLASGLADFEPDTVSAIVFTPTAAFNQTPGPGAGEPVSRDQ